MIPVPECAAHDRQTPPSPSSFPTRSAGAAISTPIPSFSTTSIRPRPSSPSGCANSAATKFAPASVAAASSASSRAARAQADASIGLRADMDALPIEETTNLPYRSTVPGRMHACGHDGHTAILLGAARYLAATRDFAGSAVVIFQPAEEGGGGAKAMLDDGLMENFAIEEVYALHNAPKLAGRRNVESARARRWPRPISSILKLEGKGGHAAFPHNCVDRHRRRRADRHGAADDRLAQRRPARIPASSRWRASPPARPTTSCRSPPSSKARCARCRRRSRDLAERRFREIVAGIAAASGVRFKARSIAATIR